MAALRHLTPRSEVLRSTFRDPAGLPDQTPPHKASKGAPLTGQGAFSPRPCWPLPAPCVWRVHTQQETETALAGVPAHGENQRRRGLCPGCWDGPGGCDCSHPGARQGKLPPAGLPVLLPRGSRDLHDGQHGGRHPGPEVCTRPRRCAGLSRSRTLLPAPSDRELGCVCPASCEPPVAPPQGPFRQR